MKVFTVQQIKEGDAYTIENEPVSSIELMERAAGNAATWIMKHYSAAHRFKIFTGTGNNGGDGLVIARILAENNYITDVFVIRASSNESDDFKENYERLSMQTSINPVNLFDHDEMPVIENDCVVIDAMFGSGLTRPLTGFAAHIVHHINHNAQDIIAIDMPSGLFGEDNSANEKENIIKARQTLTFEFPKLSFFFPENERYTGNWTVIPIGINQTFIDIAQTEKYYTREEDILPLIRIRRKFAHKKNFGHALLVSGSYGKMGAAILASRACLRTGVGLLTVHIPSFGYTIIQTDVPEAMTSIDGYNKVISKIPLTENFTTVGIGPGIGKSPTTRDAFYDLLQNLRLPMVIDADAINILSENKEMIGMIPPSSILTPHPKEFERLVGIFRDSYTRLQMLMEFTIKNNVFVVLKGAYTSVACPDGTCYFNSTGNPGMATGGSGDVLTGMILSLLAQGYSSKEASLLGVYLHGLAGDIAADVVSEESLIASDIISYIGAAFNHLSKQKNNKI
ncbi:MAG: NAD(P)H-hydrate dehydratase [Bacteroidia bacterium]|nr:NAD(P)H-hydrate dehydratase [Bacteroidia bacterium]